MLVAVSGGVDSAVLLAVAVEALGSDRVVAITGRSASLAAGEADAAATVASQVGCRHRILDTDELADPDYRANRGDRCYHCRSELFARLREVGRHEGFRAIAYGAIADDLGDDRPGMRAAEEFAVLAPLLDAGFTKADVRWFAASRGLAVHDKPASACLSSRIPVGSEVTPAKLRQVERAEAGLRALGFVQLRVRHHGQVAHVELDTEGLRQVADPAVRERVADEVRRAGFRAVRVDPDGYRGGRGKPPVGRQLYSIEPARDGGQ